jgi:heat shock protein HslJ
MKQLSLVILLCFVFSCSNADISEKAKEESVPASDQITPQENKHIYWVNSSKAECVGVGPMQCLKIQKGEELQSDGWELFYAPICGFEYEQGYIYKIAVKEEPIPPEQIPADGSSKRYILIEVLDKQIDGKLRLYDIWVLESIKGDQLILGDTQKRPQVEINLQKMTISGNDSCNNFTGGIKNVGSEELMFGPIAATRKACMDMDIPDRFHQDINNVQFYLIKDLKLYLFDNQRNELFVLKKID